MIRNLEGRDYHLEPVFTDSFRTADNWRCEGVGARMWTDAGWLYCDAREGEVHAATVWCTAAEFNDPLWIEFDIRFVEGRFNGNLIFHGRGADGSDILATSHSRTGDYGEYHVFPNYIVTFLTDDQQVRIRYRRDPGFALLGEVFYGPPLEHNCTYHVILLHQAGKLQFFVDGVKRYDGTDPGPPLTSGRFAWRTWRTYLGWSNLAVYRIIR